MLVQVEPMFQQVSDQQDEVPPPWKKAKKASVQKAFQERGEEAVGCYIWGTHLSTMIDVMVLGNSLKETGLKASRLLCINEDTEELSIAVLMKAFWNFVHVTHVELPEHLEGTAQRRLRGVYSKLQTMAIFDRRPHKMKRFLLMDADMLVKYNIDDAFAHSVPAGVMRGDRDSRLYEKRPAQSYFGPRHTMREGDTYPKMIGGINGGLILFEPSVKTYDDMMRVLETWKPYTRQAEQEFLSFYWGRKGEIAAMPKKYNYQLHQTFFLAPFGTEEGESQNSASRMIEHPEEIKVFHFSADQKPSMILTNVMKSVEGWLTMDDHLAAHAEYMMTEHGVKNKHFETRPDWAEKVIKHMKAAHVEWFEAWKRTYVSVVEHVFNSACSKLRNKIWHEGEHFQCPSCEAAWPISDIVYNSNTIRDHLMFNCDVMAGEIRIPVKHQTNLRTFFFPPCGPQVESKMLYLAEVFLYYDNMEKMKKKHSIAWNLNHEVEPEIRLPLYIIPKHILATTEDMGVDAASVNKEEQNETEKSVSRRYIRALDTIRKVENAFFWRKAPKLAEQWESTLKTVKDSGLWLMRHHRSIQETATSKTQGGAAASSSSGDSTMRAGGAAASTYAPPDLVPPPPPRPPNRRREVRPKTMPTKTMAKSPMPPPPPPSRR